MKENENQPIRVLQVFTILNRGGAETMIMNYYRHIDRTKVQFDFAVHREEKGAYEDEIIALGGKIYRFLPFHPKNFTEYKKQIIRFFDEHPEYQIVHGHTSHLGYFFYKEAKKREIPCIIIHSHNTGMDIDIKAPFHVFFKWASCKHPTHYFSCGQKASDWLFGKHPKKNVYMMNNAIDAGKFSYNEANSITMKQKLNLEGKFIIGHVGRMNLQKNHFLLLDIFKEVHSKINNSALVLVGEGELRRQIETRARILKLEESVIFLGIRNDIPDILQAFDLFLFPSKYEGLPVVIIEAQAAGLKCIVSDGIPQEAAIIPDLVEFISLKEKSLYWANEVLKYENNYNRRNSSEEVRISGYDINDNVKWLENFYFETISK